MKQRLLIGVLLLGASAFIYTSDVKADGCYICTSGSSAACKHYCRYTGSDNWENRKKCEKAGCKIGGTATCPTGANYRICTASAESIVEYLAAKYGLKL